MRKVKRYEEGGDVEYETQDSEGNDINPDEMYSSTIDRNAQRLIAENEKKSTGNAGNKAVTRVSKTTRIEPIIPEDKASEEETANKKSYESKGVGVGSSDVAKRGMGTRSAEAKERGAKTFEEGLPSVIPGAIAGKGIKYAKGALDEMRAANAASKLNSVPMAKQLSGPSSTKMLEGPSTPKLLTGPRGETKLLTSNVSKASAENSPAIEQAMTGRSMSSGAIKRQSERDRIAALRERRGITQGPRNMGYKSGGSVSSASSRGDGIAQRGKTRGKVC